MRLSTKLLIGLGVVTLAVGGFTIVTVCKNWNSFEAYIKGEEKPVYTVIDEEEGTVAVYNTTDPTLSQIASYAAGRGWDGGISTHSMETVGEGEIPAIVTENNADTWYSISTEEGLHYMIITGEGIISD